MKGILGRKAGMTEVFTADGKLIPVTVIEVQSNVVTQIKTVEKDGYDAIQLGAFDKKEKASNNPEKGHAKKANTSPKRFLKEIRGIDTNSYTLGQVIEADVFQNGDTVDVTGTSKGKGFQGVIKRHGQVDVDMENKCILVSGNVPGPKNSFVFIKEAIKGSKNTPVELISYEESVAETEEVTPANEVVENDAVVEETNVEATETTTDKEEVSE